MTPRPETHLTREHTSLRTANIARQAEWDTGSEKLSLSFKATELAGEVGEACNVVKKLERERLGIKGSRDTLEHLAEELADVVICADLVALHEGIDLDAAVRAKFNATSEKVGLQTRLSTLPPSEPDAVLAEREACRDMATCPRDGTEIIGWRPDQGAFVFRWASIGEVVPKDACGGPIEDYDEHEGWWHEQWGWLEGELEPHLWLPMPTFRARGTTPQGGEKRSLTAEEEALTWQALRVSTTLVETLPSPDAQRPVEADGWQPIDTAPKDGTRILVTGGTGDYTGFFAPSPWPLITAEIARWHEGSWQGEYGREFDERYIYEPALWQPLPALRSRTQPHSETPGKEG